ncbi:hypothetical protein A0O34_15135 [Chryseobacterium glaciei]|uniref:Lipoprotein n=1 Tax=Chryseobacterium glaciei TaxID=1685010 RepID=A0A172XXM2_9FLAO|nr:hypothetical protein [Chryseobacterium glaciei]ANF51757.1 hypothetical protein A0O34_15135 [Chryseobacterium glaciei]
MKKTILLTLSLFLLSCGTRQKDLQKNETKTESENSVNSSSEAAVKINRKDSQLQVSDLSKTKISVIPKVNKCSDPQNPTQPPQPRNMNVKDSKGNEVNIPVDENSEIHIENTSELETKLKSTELELGISEKENINLQTKNTELQKQIDSSVKSNKPMWWLYILIFVLGVLFIPIIKFFIRK